MESPNQARNPVAVEQEDSHRLLSSLLSQVLVAFTVEFDNEFERRMAESGYVGARLSLVAWSNLIRFIPENGISVRDLTLRSLAEPRQVKLMLGCLERWGFLALHAEAKADQDLPLRAERLVPGNLRDGWGSGRGIGAGWQVRLTAKGQKAKETWPPLFDEIERRWQARLGTGKINLLRQSLQAIVARAEVELPQGLMDVRERSKGFPAKRASDTQHFSLPTLLSQALLMFALQFEPKSNAPLALCANTIRVLSEKPTRARDIALLTGGSPEATGIGWQLKPYVGVGPEPGTTRGKTLRLTRRGVEVQQAYWHIAREIEKNWELRAGEETIGCLRESLLALFRMPDGKRPLLSQGLIPPPGVVRAGGTAPALGRREVGPAARQRTRDLVAQTEAFVRDPAGALPHYPMWDFNRGFGP